MFSPFWKTLNSKKSRSRSRHGERSNHRKSNSSNHPSRVDNHYSSYHNLNYNQYPSRQPRNRNNYGPRDSKVDLLGFYGKENIEDYLKWVMKVKQYLIVTILIKKRE